MDIIISLLQNLSKMLFTQKDFSSFENIWSDMRMGTTPVFVSLKMQVRSCINLIRFMTSVVVAITCRHFYRAHASVKHLGFVAGISTLFVIVPQI